MMAVMLPALSLESGSGPKAWICSCFSSACSIVVVSTITRPVSLAEELVEHDDDVLEGVVVVVEQDDVVGGLPARALLALHVGPGRQGDGVAHRG
jgi:hypothetical protein